MRKFLLSILIPTCSGCGLPALYEVRPQSLTKEESLRRRVITILGASKSADEAQRAMESQGFSCKIIKKSRFDYATTVSQGANPNKPYDFILCQRNSSARGTLYEENVAIALSGKRSTTGDVFVRRDQVLDEASLIIGDAEKGRDAAMIIE